MRGLPWRGTQDVEDSGYPRSRPCHARPADSPSRRQALRSRSPTTADARPSCADARLWTSSRTSRPRTRQAARLARVTGQYKHGNERTAKQHPRNRRRVRAAARSVDAERRRAARDVGAGRSLGRREPVAEERHHRPDLVLAGGSGSPSPVFVLPTRASCSRRHSSRVVVRVAADGQVGGQPDVFVTVEAADDDPVAGDHHRRVPGRRATAPSRCSSHGRRAVAAPDITSSESGAGLPSWDASVSRPSVGRRRRWAPGRGLPVGHDGHRRTATPQPAGDRPPSDCSPTVCETTRS